VPRGRRRGDEGWELRLTDAVGRRLDDGYRTDVTLQPQVEPGSSASIELLVSDADTASAFRSGDVPVLATPRALALGEEATVAALEGHLAEGYTSVGMRVSLDHVKASPVGSVVTATAVVERIEGRRITFTVELLDRDNEVVAQGRVVRVLMKRADFLARLADVPTVSGRAELR